jgi:hypothetical protein
MRIVGASSSVSTVTRRSDNEAQDGPALDAPRSTLIAVQAPRRAERFPQPARYLSAPFLAHLLATRMQEPQTRARRRAEPDEAAAVYQSMTKPVTARRAFGRRV